MKRVLILLAAILALSSVVGAAQVATQEANATPPPTLEGPNGEHQVVVCKYVGTPGVDEVLQTGQNPIVVDYHALLGAGFDGTFPFPFSDAQGQSIAVQWTADVHFSDLSVCPPGDSPTMVDVCDPESGDIISVPEDDADNYLPVDDPACAPVEPGTETGCVPDPDSPGDYYLAEYPEGEAPPGAIQQGTHGLDENCETTLVENPPNPPDNPTPDAPPGQPTPGEELPHTL